MIEPTNTPTTDRTRLMISAVCLFIAVLLVLFFLLGPRTRPLKPLRTSETADPLPISSEANFVTFTDLNGSPVDYLNQFIRVSGSFNPLPLPECLPHSGPDIRWSLIADELQLDAIGFETIVREVPPGTVLTVQGIWRRYHGPFGCGKQPPPNDAWYLEVTQIIEPNPLFGADTVALDTILGPSPTPNNGEPPSPTAVNAQPTDEPTATPTAVTPPTTTATLIFTPTPTTILLATETPTLIGTPSPSPTAASGTLTATPTPTLTPTPTVTTAPGTPGTPTLTPTVTQTPTAAPVPPTLVVATPDPYQGPTPSGYP